MREATQFNSVEVIAFLASESERRGCNMPRNLALIFEMTCEGPAGKAILVHRKYWEVSKMF